MRCTAKKKDGTPCPNQARAGCRVCWVHDERLAEQRAEGRRKGGLARMGAMASPAPLALPEDTPWLKLNNIADAKTAVAEAFNLVRVGKMAVAVGNCLGFLAGVFAKLHEVGEMEERLAELEEQVQEQKRTTRVRSYG